MITREELIAIGHYNKPHGVAGELSATVDVEIDVLGALSCLVSEMDGIYAVCPKCGEKYDIGSGYAMPQKGISKEAMRPMNISQNGGRLIITQKQ